MITEPQLGSGSDPATDHLADSAFWAAAPDHRHAVFARLRREEPVRWFEPRTSAFSRPCTGFWALTRYDDVRRVSRDPRTFCSQVTIDIEETPAELGAFFPSMINLDDPEHLRLRRMVSSGFTPRRIATLTQQLRVGAGRIVDDVIDRYGDGSEFDLVERISARLPLHAIGSLMGVPEEDQAQLYEWTNLAVSPDDPTTGIDGAAAGMQAIADYASRLGAERRSRPTGDLTSVLMHAEVDGERLGTEEYVNFFILLVSAGNETTRNAISHGVRLLTEHPDQRRIWFDDFDRHAATAIEEIVRYETPITNMARVLTTDAEISGVRLAAGEKVVMWYTSANRDEDAFADAHRFEVRRPLSPPHVAYGAGGPHFCLGAGLARLEMTVMFDEIRRRLPDLHVCGEPERVLSMGLNAIRSLPARIR